MYDLHAVTTNDKVTTEYLQENGKSYQDISNPVVMWRYFFYDGQPWFEIIHPEGLNLRTGKSGLASSHYPSRKDIKDLVVEIDDV